MYAKIHDKRFRNNLLLLVLLFMFLAILSACGGAAATEEPAAPAQPAATEVPAEPVEPEQQYPVQYGQDSRTELFQHPDSKLKEMANSVAIFVHTSQVNISGDAVTLEGYTLNQMSEMGWLVGGVQAPMCSNELFTSQPAPGFCTGFLVDEDILVTAGHCLQKTPCADTSVVFGFQMDSPDSLATLTISNVFKCTEVIAQVLPDQNNQLLDYAIIKLDRPTGRVGLDYAAEDHLEAQNNVAVLGHPSGLPMKIASDAYILSNQADNPFFVTNLDTFGSNSGSPVINLDTYQVEGILVRGEVDYVLSSDNSCIQVNRCPESGDTNCSGENATKMAVLADLIPAGAATDPNGLSCFPTLLFVFAVPALMRLKPR